MPNDENEMDAHLDQPATRRDVRELRTDVGELRDATRRDLIELREELRRHFDVVAESFKTEFKNSFDWAEATTSSTGTRVDEIEAEHGARLSSLELRVTRLEHRPGRKPPAS